MSSNESDGSAGVSGVSRVVSSKDTMMDYARLDAYLKIGESALAHCKRALQGSIPKRIVDFPCGYGRVMRWFRHE